MLLFYALLLLLLGLTALFPVRARGLPCYSYGVSHRTRALLHSYRAAVYARSGGSDSVDMGEDGRSLPSDGGCKELKKCLNRLYEKTGSTSSFGFVVSYSATPVTCRKGTVVWSMTVSTLE